MRPAFTASPVNALFPPPLLRAGQADRCGRVNTVRDCARRHLPVRPPRHRSALSGARRPSSFLLRCPASS
eukprot:4840025-Heterocapsa_arctica.AAC.1